MGTQATIGFVPDSQVGANCRTGGTRVRLLRHVGAALIAATLFICFALVPCAWADECPAGGQHEYVAELVEQATAESDGSRTFTCVKCGYAYTQSIPKTGHDWGPWIQDVLPTCTSEGHEYRECRQHPDNPHYEDRIIPELSSDGRHVWVEQSREEPTTASSGYVSYVCGVCGAQYEEPLPAIQAEPDETLSPEVGIDDKVDGRTNASINQAEVVSQPPERSNDGASKGLAMNEFDLAMALIDVTGLVTFAIVSAPLVFQALWIRRRRREAAQACAFAGSTSQSATRQTPVRQDWGHR